MDQKGQAVSGASTVDVQEDAVPDGADHLERDSDALTERIQQANT
jgi:hypothetical protein